MTEQKLLHFTVNVHAGILQMAIFNLSSCNMKIQVGILAKASPSLTIITPAREILIECGERRVITFFYSSSRTELAEIIAVWMNELNYAQLYREPITLPSNSSLNLDKGMNITQCIPELYRTEIPIASYSKMAPQDWITLIEHHIPTRMTALLRSEMLRWWSYSPLMIVEYQFPALIIYAEEKRNWDVDILTWLACAASVSDKTLAYQIGTLVTKFDNAIVCEADMRIIRDCWAQLSQALVKAHHTIPKIEGYLDVDSFQDLHPADLLIIERALRQIEVEFNG